MTALLAILGAVGAIGALSTATLAVLYAREAKRATEEKLTRGMVEFDLSKAMAELGICAEQKSDYRRAVVRQKRELRELEGELDGIIMECRDIPAVRVRVRERVQRLFQGRRRDSADSDSPGEG